MHNPLQKIINFLYPNYCANCGKLLNEQDPNCFCVECWKKINIIKGETCKKCGKSVITPEGICNECRKIKKFYYDKIKVIGIYEDILKQAIHLYKYKGRWKLGVDFFNLIVDYVEPQYIIHNDIIIPVPLSKEKLYKRGFSQTLHISKEIGRYYNLPVYSNILLKYKDTPPQSTLSREKRLKNLEHSFKVKHKEKIYNKNILLFDDVYTTGATVRECSKVLKENGAKRINVLTIARGI